VRNTLQAHTISVNSVAFSPDGRHIVSGSWDHTIRVWDVQTGGQVGNTLQGHTASVWSVAFSPDGRHIVSGSKDVTIQVWNIQTASQVGNPLQGHTSSVWSVAFSPDGRHIMLGSEDHTIQCWDAHIQSRSAQAGNFPTMMIQPNPSQFVKHSKHLGHSLFLKDDGWVVDSNDQLFLWVPPSYHPFYLYSPSTRLIIGNFPTLDISNMAHGTGWHQCFLSHSNSV